MLHVNVQELVKHFRPFAPPPPPVAMNSAEAKAKRAFRLKPTIKSYSATLTILESTHPNGSKIYHTRTSPIREDPLPPSAIIEEGQIVESPPLPRQPFLCHMRERQRRWEGIRNRHGERMVWRTISVRRQRKLKMKKHKYRKFMRRTRNLRRRLDRNWAWHVGWNFSITSIQRPSLTSIGWRLSLGLLVIWCWTFEAKSIHQAGVFHWPVWFSIPFPHPCSPSLSFPICLFSVVGSKIAEVYMQSAQARKDTNRFS